MENLVVIFFYLISILLVGSVFGVIFSNGIKTVLFYTLISFFGFGLISFLLNCAINGVCQIILGCGGALLLLGFLAVLTPKKSANEVKLKFRPRMILSLGAVGMVFLTLMWALFDNYLKRLLDILSDSFRINYGISTSETISETMLSNYAVGIGVVALILLLIAVGIGMVGIFKQNEEKM